MRDRRQSLFRIAHVDEEEFAAAWRPMTESEMLDEIIAERIAALGARSGVARTETTSKTEAASRPAIPIPIRRPHH